MEGDQGWDSKSSRGYRHLPESRKVDHLPTPIVQALAARVQPVLESFGLVRLFHEGLLSPLPPNLDVPTVLSGRAHTLFDALYYWKD